MEIRLLRSFVSVANTKNFSAAARELNTVQPAISRQIAELENELGVQLFWRNKREVKITAAGQSLLRDAYDILAKEQWAKEQAKRAAEGQIGTLRIAYLGSASFKFLPKLIKGYTDLYPEVQIKLTEMTAQEQLDAFREEKIDVGISRPLPKRSEKGFSWRNIYTDSLVTVLPAQHELAHKQTIEIKEIENENLILFKRSEAPGLFDQIIALFQKEKISPNIKSESNNMQTLITEVASGLGITIVPSCTKDLYTENSVFIPIKKQKPSIETQIQYRIENRSATVQAFVKLTMESKDLIQKQIKS